MTGLLGFAQVYWDDNRQMIHDKVVERVVVRERAGSRAAVAAPRVHAATGATAPAPPPALRR